MTAPPDHPATIAEALAELQTQLPHIAKDSEVDIPGRNRVHRYADLAALHRELLPAMGKLGLSFSCKPTMRKGVFGLRYKLRLTGTDETDKGWWPLPSGQPQATGSALTYYRRYILSCLTGAVADDDDDGGQAAAQGDTERGDGGRWMNRRPDVPSKDLQDKRTPAKTTGSEHEQLRDGTVEATPGDRPAKRVRGTEPEGDPWLDQPAGTYDETPPEERTGSIDGRQRSQIFAKLALLHITGADAQRQVLGDILRREVSSRASLSYTEAAKVLDDLAARVEAKEAAEQANAAAAEQDAAEVDAP